MTENENIKQLLKIKAAAKKLVSIFPETIPEDCEKTKFDIPAYIIEELNQALNNRKHIIISNSCVSCASVDGDCCGMIYWADDGKFLCNECGREFDIKLAK